MFSERLRELTSNSWRCKSVGTVTENYVHDLHVYDPIAIAGKVHHDVYVCNNIESFWKKEWRRLIYGYYLGPKKYVNEAKKDERAEKRGAVLLVTGNGAVCTVIFAQGNEIHKIYVSGCEDSQNVACELMIFFKK